MNGLFNIPGFKILTDNQLLIIFSSRHSSINIRLLTKNALLAPLIKYLKLRGRENLY